jgi:hypothetical protein
MKNKTTVTKSGATIEYDLYARVVAMTPGDALRFWGTQDGDPVDLGPANPERYKDGARVWGFPSREETAEEKATRLWTVAQSREVMT